MQIMSYIDTERFSFSLNFTYF